MSSTLTLLIVSRAHPQFLSAHTNPAFQDARGNSAALGMSAALLVVSLVLRWYMGYLNKKKHEVQFSDQMIELREKSLEDLGEYHPGMVHPFLRAMAIITYLPRAADFFHTT